MSMIKYITGVLGIILVFAFVLALLISISSILPLVLILVMLVGIVKAAFSTQSNITNNVKFDDVTLQYRFMMKLLYDTSSYPAWLRYSLFVIIFTAIAGLFREISINYSGLIFKGDLGAVIEGKIFMFFGIPLNLMPMFDQVWITYALICLCIWGLNDYIWRFRLIRQINIIPTSKVRSVALGLVELKGTAQPIDKNNKFPLLSQVIIEKNYPDSQKKYHEVDENHSAFCLEDDTGRILVETDGAEFLGPTQTIFFHPIRFYRICLLRHFTKENSLTELKLMPGDPIFVIGTVQNRAITTLAKDAPKEELVIRPLSSDKKRFSFFDVFYLTDQSEAETVQLIRKGIGISLITTIILMYTSFLAISKLENSTGNYESAYNIPIKNIKRM